ncbi:hypothetical protein [Streptomyces lydicus]|uniref:hypothetical protein n=1 Tax=Streptomyces lydicus TaxID=47763 RepID=UPI0036E62547
MNYRLHLDPALHATYKALPDEARGDLSVCLLDAMADPLAHSEPYGADDGKMRTVARGSVSGVILIGVEEIILVQLTYIG